MSPVSPPPYRPSECIRSSTVGCHVAGMEDMGGRILSDSADSSDELLGNLCSPRVCFNANDSNSVISEQVPHLAIPDAQPLARTLELIPISKSVPAAVMAPLSTFTLRSPQAALQFANYLVSKRVALLDYLYSLHCDENKDESEYSASLWGNTIVLTKDDIMHYFCVSDTSAEDSFANSAVRRDCEVVSPRERDSQKCKPVSGRAPAAPGCAGLEKARNSQLHHRSAAVCKSSFLRKYMYRWFLLGLLVGETIDRYSILEPTDSADRSSAISQMGAIGNKVQNFICALYELVMEFSTFTRRTIAGHSFSTGTNKTHKALQQQRQLGQNVGGHAGSVTSAIVSSRELHIAQLTEELRGTRAQLRPQMGTSDAAQVARREGELKAAIDAVKTGKEWYPADEKISVVNSENLSAGARYGRYHVIDDSEVCGSLLAPTVHHRAASNFKAKSLFSEDDHTLGSHHGSKTLEEPWLWKDPGMDSISCGGYLAYDAVVPAVLQTLSLAYRYMLFSVSDLCAFKSSCQGATGGARSSRSGVDVSQDSVSSVRGGTYAEVYQHGIARGVTQLLEIDKKLNKSFFTPLLTELNEIAVYNLECEADKLYKDMFTPLREFSEYISYPDLVSIVTGTNAAQPVQSVQRFPRVESAANVKRTEVGGETSAELELSILVEKYTKFHKDQNVLTVTSKKNIEESSAKLLPTVILQSETQGLICSEDADNATGFEDEAVTLDTTYSNTTSEDDISIYSGPNNPDYKSELSFSDSDELVVNY